MQPSKSMRAMLNWLNSFQLLDLLKINMKLMKTGSYSNGLRILREAKAAGMRTMIGCMVETTLGISSALNLSGLADYVDLDSFLLLKDEPFVLVKEQNGILYFKDADKLCT